MQNLKFGKNDIPYDFEAGQLRLLVLHIAIGLKIKLETVSNLAW
jgi:hypothetical protein